MRNSNYQKGKDKKGNSNKGGNRNNYRSNKSKNNSRSNGNNSKQGEGFNQEERPTNDYTWHAPNEELLRDAASIPFSWSTGVPYDMGFSHSPLYELDKPNDIMPGICTLGVRPSLGASDRPTDALNIASNSLYTFVRKLNSGSKNYDAPDLMLYILAMTSVYSMITWLQRIYGFATMYTLRNRYFPDALINSNFVDAEDVRDNLAQFRTGINLLIAKAASFCVPANIDLFRYHAFLYSNLYCESGDIKDQVYMYVPDGFWFYQLNEDGSGMLKFKLLGEGVEVENPQKLKVSELLKYANNMLDVLMYSEDIGIMNGDVLKAFGDGNILKLRMMDESFSVPISNDIVALEQIQNSVILPAEFAYAEGSGDVTQDSTHGFLLYKNDWTATVSMDRKTTEDAAKAMSTLAYAANRMINTVVNNPDPTLVMDITRNVIAVDDWDYVDNKGVEPGLAVNIHVVSGSVVLVYCHLWQFENTNNGETTFNIYNFCTFEWSKYDPTKQPTLAPGVNTALSTKLGYASKFNFFPRIYEVQMQLGSNNTSVSINDIRIKRVNDFGQLCNYAILTPEVIKNLHDVSIFGELAAPLVALVQKGVTGK